MSWLVRLLAFGASVSIALVTYRVWRRHRSPEHWIRRAALAGGVIVTALFLHSAWHASRMNRAAAQEHAATSRRGAHAFQELGCGNCHSIGGGVVVGPDLRSAAHKYDHDTLVRWIEDPDSIYAARHTHPLNQGFTEMPNLGVGEQEAEAIAAYLASVAATQP